MKIKTILNKLPLEQSKELGWVVNQCKMELRLLIKKV
jgi:hypothetical protein